MIYSEKLVFRVFIVASVFLLLLPYAFRVMGNNSTLPGDGAYYDARIAENMVSGDFSGSDDLVIGGRQAQLSPYHFSLAFFSLFFGVIGASVVLPLLLGVASLAVFYFILKKMRLRKLALFSVLGVFLLLPVFTYSFSVSGPGSLIIFLNLLGLYLFMQKKKWCTALSALCFGTCSLFGILHAVASAAVVFFYSLYSRKHRRSAYVILFLILLVMLAYNIPQYILLEHVDFIQRSLVTDFLSDLGGVGGFSVFSLLLAALGVVFVWRFKKKFYSLYLFSFALVIYSFFDNDALIYSGMVIVFVAGLAISSLAGMKWQLGRVRDFTLLVLFCGLLFSYISHAAILGSLKPDEDYMDALRWLNHRSNPGDAVFSHYSKGFWIQFWAGRPVLLDSILDATPNSYGRYVDSEAVFSSNDISITRGILSKYGIKYVFVTEDMPQGFVGRTDYQGLDFLLTNNETFKKRYNNPCCEIYEYIYEKK